jgi:RNA polymerase sigma-70 factor (ECF subfamily)
MHLAAGHDRDAEDPGPPPPGDAEHTLRVQQLFVRHQNSLRAFILTLLPDFAEAEDVLQEVFVTITRKAADFQLGTHFLNWAFAIARFKVLDARRRSRHADQLLDVAALEALAVDLPEDILCEGRQQAVRRCLERLAPRARELVRLRYFSEHEPGEIARLVAWTPRAVNSALCKARGFLRRCVQHQLGGEI